MPAADSSFCTRAGAGGSPRAGIKSDRRARRPPSLLPLRGIRGFARGLVFLVLIEGGVHLRADRRIGRGSDRLGAGSESCMRKSSSSFNCVRVGKSSSFFKLK